MKTWKAKLTLRNIFVSWRLSVARELWWNKLDNGNKQFLLFGVTIEQDALDPTLKVWIFIFFGISFSIGILK